jgi:hypothetical protein
MGGRSKPVVVPVPTASATSQPVVQAALPPPPMQENPAMQSQTAGKKAAAAMAAGLGMDGTILTSGTGTSGSPSTSRKSLLGA